MNNRVSRYLILKGCAGLGNRIYSLCNAISLAKRLDRQLFVDWRDGQFDVVGEDAFSKYFTLENVDYCLDSPEVKTVYPEIKGISTAPIYDVAKYNVGPIPTAHRWFRGKWARLGGYWTSIEGSPMMSRKSVEPGSLLVDRQEEALCYVDFSPRFEADIFKRHVRLKPEWQGQVNEFARAHRLDQCVGLHIRYTDKKPTQQIDRLIDNLRTHYHDQGIFLATDNVEIETLLQEQGFRIIKTDKFLPKEAKEGLHQYALRNNRPELAARVMKESIMDMWLLATCEVLMYQGNSSFSIISRALRSDTKRSIDWLNDC